MLKKEINIDKTPHDLAKSLGLTLSDVVEWEVRHSLTQKIIQTFNKSSYTTAQIVKDSGISRAHITKILKDDTSGISLDILFRVLGAIGQKVKLDFKKVI